MLVDYDWPQTNMLTCVVFSIRHYPVTVTRVVLNA
jgi:hypothetical protein